MAHNNGITRVYRYVGSSYGQKRRETRGLGIETRCQVNIFFFLSLKPPFRLGFIFYNIVWVRCKTVCCEIKIRENRNFYLPRI